MIQKKFLASIPPMDMPAAPSGNPAYLFTARILMQGEAKILDLHVWAPNADTPFGLIARVFINKSSKTHATLFVGQKNYCKSKKGKGVEDCVDPVPHRWSKAALWRVTGGYSDYGDISYRAVFADDASKTIAGRYMGGNPIDAISDFQSAIRKKITDKQKAVKEKAIAKAMRQISDLPPDWKEFVEDHVMLHSRYIVYRREKNKQIHGFCTKCGSDVRLDKAKHNTHNVCPSCGSRVILKSQGITNWLQDEGRGVFIQPAENGAMIVRNFYFVRNYEKGFKSFSQRGCETLRYFVNDLDVSMYDKYDGKWRARNNIDEEKAMVYPSNVKETLAPTRYQYSGLDVQAQSYTPIYPIGYLRRYFESPCIEYLPKMGLYRFTADLSGYNGVNLINSKAKKPMEVFPFSKEAIKTFARLDMDSDEISAYKSYEKSGHRLTDEWILRFRESGIYPTSLLNIREGISPFKAFRYLAKQKTKEHSTSNLISIWQDYFKMAENAEYDLTDEYYLYPPKLIELHDELDSIGRMKKIDKKYIAKMEKLAKEYDHLNFYGNQFIIRVPKSLDDLVYDGMKQKICIANPSNGYIKAYCSKQKYLLFLRRAKEPDAPFVTFEMFENGRIGQVSGFHNYSVSRQVESAIARWRKEIAEPFIARKIKQPLKVAV